MATVGDTKERILNSALDLIYARSYASVGVQELCEHAGGKKGSFYHFFPSKRDLTIAALERQWEIAKRAIWDPHSRTISHCTQSWGAASISFTNVSAM